MKRFFDITAAGIGLIFIAPIITIFGLLIRTTSIGPVFFRQNRVGLNGKIFLVYKFRTMVDRAEDLGTSVTTGNDARITPLGRFLRRTKLDELPQLMNVFNGEMSLVGPRPDVPEIVKIWKWMVLTDKDLLSFLFDSCNLRNLWMKRLFDLISSGGVLVDVYAPAGRYGQDPVRRLPLPWARMLASLGEIVQVFGIRRLPFAPSIWSYNLGQPGFP